MKRTPLLTALALVASLLFVSCKNSGADGLSVPKDAVMVFHVDAHSLGSKLSWKEIKETPIFQEMYAKSRDSFGKKIMNDPDESGVDVSSDFVFFINSTSKGSMNMVFEGNLKDEGDFETFLKKMDKGNKIETDGNMKFVRGSSTSLCGWTRKHFYVVANTRTNYSGMYDDDERPQTNAFDSIKKFAKALASMSSGSSLQSDAKFGDLLKDKGDVHLYMNMEKYYGIMPMNQLGGEFQMLFSAFSKMFKGSIQTSTVNFDDGKITMKSKQYLGPEVDKIFAKAKFEPVTEALVNRIPSQNVAAAFVSNYPPSLGREFLNALNLESMANVYLSRYNLSIEEMLQASKGQMVVALTDFTMKADSSSYMMMPHPDFKVVAGMSVNNKTTFNKMMNVMHMLADSMHEADAFSKVSYQANDDWFAIGNSNDAVQNFLGGKGNTQPFASRISGHPVGFYMDLQKMMDAFGMMETNPILGVSKGFWQDIVFTGGDYKNGVVTSEGSLNLVDKSTNSLKQLKNYVLKMYDAQMNQQKERMRMYEEKDSAASEVVPAMPSENSK